MTDRELLELAAKAVGAKRTDYSDKTPDHWVLKHSDGVWRRWNPLTDDGDALRLAVGLEIGVIYSRNPPPEMNLPSECAIANFGKRWVSEYARQCGGEAEATRRAITRAAAEIGKVMK